MLAFSEFKCQYGGMEMDMFNLDEVVDKLISIDREKYNGLLRILDLTKEQHNMILEANIEKLNELIELRQAEISILEGLDKEYSMIVDNIKSEYKVDSLEQLKVSDNRKAKELESIIEGIKRAMKEINSYEEENHRVLDEQKKEFKTKLKQINQGKKAEKMYQTKGYVQPVFYDRKTHY